MPGCKLVTDFRNTKVTGPYLDEAGTVLPFSNNHGIDNPVLIAAHRNRSIPAFLNGNEFSGGFFKEPWRRGFSDQDIFFRYNGFRINHPVLIQVLVRICPVSTGDILFRHFNPVDLTTGITAFFSFIGPEEMGAPQTTFYRSLVEDECIFNVVSFIGKNCNNKILPGRTIVRTDQFRSLGMSKGFLHVVEQVTAGIRAQFHIGCTKSQCLFDHACTHRNTGACVMFRERDVCSTNTENQRGVDLQVSVIGSYVLGVHCNEEIFFFLSVNKLNQPTLDK